MAGRRITSRLSVAGFQAQLQEADVGVVRRPHSVLQANE
jgi:hypothetical protein